MSREIKFRAWDSVDGRWFAPTFEAHAGRLEELLISPEGRLGLRTLDGFEDESLFKGRFELNQYTGLKDKNGVEIYEGDILQRPSTINGEYHGDWIRDEVISKPGQWFISHIASEKGKLPRGYSAGPLIDSYFDYDGKLYAFSDDYEPTCVGEVIGNIYENPELLESA